MPDRLLRPVAGVPLWLSAMPGRLAPMEEYASAMHARRIADILCLTSPAEIAMRSPDYAAALRDEALVCTLHAFPIADFSTPADQVAFGRWVQHQAASLRAGTPMLMHCMAGIGRTGMVGICLLRALGFADADARIAAAGSHPETPEQREVAAQFPFTPAR